MKINENIQLNIGLENNSSTVEKIIDSLFETGLINQISNFKVVTGRYKGKAERTIVIEGITSKSIVFCVDMIQRMCSDLNQDCIAAKFHNIEALIYSGSYQGEKMKFDNEYFLTIKK